MRLSKPLSITALTVAITAGASAQRGQDPINRIREADIKADLFALAGDAMRGREGGTLDEMTASAWVAERAREAGLQPAGDNGTYFQFFPLERYRVSASSPVTIGGKKLVMGRDVVTDAVVLANVDAPIVVADADALAGPGSQGQGAHGAIRAASRSASGQAAPPAGRARRAGRSSHVRAHIQRAVANPARPPSSSSSPTNRKTSGSASPFRSRAAPTRSIPTARPNSARRRAACRCSM